MVKRNLYGHGKHWLRGDMISEESSGFSYLAIAKKNQYLPATMVVKSAEFSSSGALRKEKAVLDMLKGCPHIRTCYGEEITTADIGGRKVYNLLMECGSGRTLEDLIKKSGGFGLPESEVRNYTKSMLLGLRYTHVREYVHNNLEPKNILLFPSSTGSGYVAKIGTNGHVEKVGSSRWAAIDAYLRGGIRYMSPEAVARNLQHMPSDIWALGCIVFEMLKGKSIWEGQTDSEITSELSSVGTCGRPLPMLEDTSGISEEAKDFLNACFEPRFWERFTAEQLLAHPFVAQLRFKAAKQTKGVASAPRSIYRVESMGGSSSVILAV